MGRVNDLLEGDREDRLGGVVLGDEVVEWRL